MPLARRTFSVPRLLTTIASFLLVWQTAMAANVLDAGFGASGIASSPGFEIRAMARQADGKVVVTGTLSSDFAVARYNADGTLDAGFGTAGIVQTHVSTMDAPSNIVVQSNGKLVVAGRSSVSAVAMIRYESGGTLDSTFGTAGIATTAAYGSANVPIGFTLQPDGKMLMAASLNAGLSSRTLVARFNTNGSVDTGFGTSGRVEGTNSSSFPDWAAIALQADGKILVTGCTARGLGGDCSDISFKIARYSSTGVLDNSFGTSGVSTTNMAGSDAAYALAVQPDGKILAVGRNGSSTGGSLRDFAVYRYTSAGVLDTTFDGDGLATVDYGNNGDDALRQVTVLSNGQILAVGTGFNGLDSDGAAVLFNTNGTLDTGFANDGIFRLDAGGSETLNTLAVRNAGAGAVLGGSQLLGIVLNDADMDGITNSTDPDDDNDGVLDGADNCPYDINPDQSDIDADGLGNACDLDRDGDGLTNAAELASGTNPDLADSDGDAVNDALDIFPLNNTESADNDLDGTGNNADTDDDNDGIPDTSDAHPFIHSALDPDFGNSGYTVMPMYNGAKAFSIVRHSTGKVTLAGSDFTLARFNAGGTLDMSFGSSGKMLILPNARVNSLLDLADGRMVAVGSTNSPRGLVYLFQSNGLIDQSFSGDGGYIDPDANNVIESVQQQSDGKLLLVGGYTPLMPPLKARITRMHTDGSVDTSYGISGFAKDAISSCSDTVIGACPFVSVLQPDDKLVVATNTSAARLNTNGGLDSTFDSDGKVTISAGTSSRLLAMARQADGKLVFAGRYTNGSAYDVFVTRLNSNGTLDTSFGDSGYARLAIGAGNDVANAVAIQKNGRIVIAGVTSNGSNNDLFVARLHTNGKQDKSYYGNGVAIVDLLSTDQAAQDLVLDEQDNAMVAGYHGTAPTNFLLAKFGGNRGKRVVLQPDGKALVAGSVNSETAIAVVRYGTDGEVDSDYGGSGKVITNFGEGSETVDDSLLQQNGKLVVVGTDTAGTKDTKAHFSRYEADGSLDTAFGLAGTLALDDGAARGVAQQTDGKLVTVGRLACGADYCPGVMRLNADGSFDSAFGNAGKEVNPAFTEAEFLATTLQPADQKILATGADASTGKALVARYLTDGSPDNSFGGDGIVEVNIAAAAVILESIAVRGDGRIVAAGKKTQVNDSDVVMVQLMPDGEPDASFGNAGLQVIDLGSAEDEASSLQIHPEGYLVAAGVRSNGTDRDAVVMRFTEQGNLDTNFDGDGIKVLPGTEDDVAEDMVLSTDGMTAVIAGSSGSPAQFMLTAVGIVDTDGDGLMNDVDPDDDNDGQPDDSDPMPYDTDNDGQDNAVDDDDDNDGLADAEDSLPLHALPDLLDLNGDYRGSSVSERMTR